MEELKIILKFAFTGIKKIFKLVKIIFLVFAVYTIAIVIFFQFAIKEQSQYFSNNLEKIQKTNYEQFFNLYNESQGEEKKFLDLYKNLNCVTIGQLCSPDPSDSYEYFKESLLGKVIGLLTLPYSNPPASGIAWGINSLANLGIVPKALAAPVGGIGLNAISPFYPIWSLFRNIAYLAVVLILITIGFLIMLRTKINPQTVITVENSLPKIIISLILITLSFPIAGFLIDFMYTATLLIIFLIEPQTAVEKANAYLTGGADKLLPTDWLWAKIPFNIALNLPRVLPKILYYALYSASTILLLTLYTKIFIKEASGIISGFTKGFAVALGPMAGIQGEGVKALLAFILKYLLLLSALFSLISIGITDPTIPVPNGHKLHLSAITPVVIFLYLAVLFSIIFTVFKLFFLLLFTYIRIVLNIILSPLYMLLESLPGQSGATRWIKNMFVELLTFPLVVLFILLTAKIMTLPLSSNDYPWTPPFLYGISSEAIIYLVGTGIFLISPQLIKQIKKSLGAEKPLFDLNFKTFLFGGGALVGGALGGIQTARSFTALLPSTTQKAIRNILGPLGSMIAPPGVTEEMSKLVAKTSGEPEENKK